MIDYLNITWHYFILHSTNLTSIFLNWEILKLFVFRDPSVNQSEASNKNLLKYVDRSTFKQESEPPESPMSRRIPRFCTPEEVRARPGMHHIPNVKCFGADGNTPPLIALSKQALKQIAEYKATHPEV